MTRLNYKDDDCNIDFIPGMNFSTDATISISYIAKASTKSRFRNRKPPAVSSRSPDR